GAEFADVDINSYDLSFDANDADGALTGEIVFSAKLSTDQAFGLFVLSLETGQVEQLPTDPSRDYVYPIFLPGDKIMFATNANREEGVPQFQDEYERGTTSQLGVIGRDGSGEQLFSRNLSHRAFPTLMSDGRVMITQWDHLGEDNAGRLLIVNPDGSVAREGFGKEGTGITNSYFKPREISPGRVIAIGSDRDRTLQSGTLLDVRLGQVNDCGDDASNTLCANTAMSEANASYQILSPGVPLDRSPSSNTIGRYYDAFPLNAKEKPDLLVSWADGPVQTELLEAADVTADFGIYLYQSDRSARKPIWNDDTMWDIFPRTLTPRSAPPEIEPAGSNQFSDDAVLIGSMNVYQSTIANFEPGSVYGVQIIEGFSVEEGVPDDFGLSEFEGAALLGVTPVREDGSWAAMIPSGIPVHLQAIDKFGMSLQSEPVWVTGNAGESRFCGGCHEDRAATTVIQPGITQAVAIGPSDLMSTVARFDRRSDTFTRDAMVGIPWDDAVGTPGDGAIQAIFDAKCVSCHNGVAGAANPSYTIMDPETGMSQTIVFDLRGIEVQYGFGDAIMTGYSASHLSLLGPNMSDLEEAGLVIVGDMPIYVEPASARDSKLIQMLNPPLQYPSVDMNTRAFGDTVVPHDVAKGVPLTADEYLTLVRMADFGGQFYSRENAPGGTSY
ncbi:MAG TPA: hypothetical protein VL172_15465, partial [Kofleriaceae bacterium]|nr:hypothetical protein [Kofleriaceae bacterium]